MTAPSLEPTLTATVLIVDDSSTVRVAVSKYLGARGMKVLEAASGSQALAVAAAEKLDLVLVDSVLENESGVDLCARFRHLTNLEAVPVLILSGKEEEVWESCRGINNITGVLTKPFEAPALAALVEHELRRRRRELECSVLLDEFCGEISLGRIDSIRETATASPAVREGAALLASTLRDKVVESFKHALDGGREELARAVARAFLDSRVASTLALRLFELFRGGEDHRFVVSAEILCFTDLIQSLANQKARGILRIDAERHTVDLFLDRGHVVFLHPRRLTLSPGAENLYHRGTAIPRAVIEEFFESAPRDETSIYHTFLSRGLVRREEVRELSLAVGLELLQDCLDDPARCKFEFLPRASAPRPFLDFDLRTPVQPFLLNLFSRIDEGKALVLELGNLNEIEIETEPSKQDNLHLDDALFTEILEALEKQSCVPDVARTVKRSLFEVGRAVLGLQRLGLIKVRQRQECQTK